MLIRCASPGGEAHWVSAVPRPWPSPPGANEAPIHRPPLHQACGLGGRMGLLPRPRAALSSLWVTAVPVVVTESDPFTASCRPPFPTPHSHARLPGCSCPWLLTAPAGSQPGRALCHSAGLQGQKSPARAAQAGAGGATSGRAGLLLGDSAPPCQLPATPGPES